MAGCKIREDCQGIQHKLVPEIWTAHQIADQPSNRFQPFSFLGLNLNPTCFGRAYSVKETRIHKTTVKISGPYKHQHADQIYISKRWPKTSKTKTQTHTAVQNRRTHHPWFRLSNIQPNLFQQQLKQHSWLRPSPHSANRDSRGALGVWDGPEVDVVPC
jgi:hypothetical protein